MQVFPDGHYVGDMNWDNVVTSYDQYVLYNLDCAAKHPSIFDSLACLQAYDSLKVFGRMDATTTIEVWRVSDSSAQTLTSNSCTQLGSSGIYYWDTSNLQNQPTTLTDYVFRMYDGEWYSHGKFTLKSNRKGNAHGDSTWVIALAKSGQTCTIELWDFAGNSITLSSNVMAEIGSTGIYKWDTSNISTQPTSETWYVYKMSTGESPPDTYTGVFGLKTPESGAGGGGLLRNPPMTGGMV